MFTHTIPVLFAGGVCWVAAGLDAGVAVGPDAWEAESAAVFVRGAAAVLVVEAAVPAAVAPAAALEPAAAPAAAVVSVAALFDLDFVVEAASLAVAEVSAVSAFLDLLGLCVVAVSLALVEASAALVFDFDFDVLSPVAVVASAALALDFDFDVLPLVAVWSAASAVLVLDVELDFVVEALESAAALESSVVFDLDLDFAFGLAVLVSLWSVVVCCAAARRAEMLPATNRDATSRLNRRGLRERFIFECSFHASTSGALRGTQAGVCCRAGVGAPNQCDAGNPLGMSE